MADWVGIKKAVNNNINIPLNVQIENARNEVKESVAASETRVKTEIKSDVKNIGSSLDNSIIRNGTYIYGLIPRESVQKTFTQSTGDPFPANNEEFVLDDAINVSGSGGITKLDFEVHAEKHVNSASTNLRGRATAIVKIKIDDDPERVFQLTANHSGSSDSSDGTTAAIKLTLTSALEDTFQTSSDIDTYRDGYTETVNAGRYYGTSKTYSATTNNLILRFNKSLHVSATISRWADSSVLGKTKSSFSIDYFLSGGGESK